MYLMDMTIDGLAAFIPHEPAYRARQAYEWLLRGARPEEMTNLPKTVREALARVPFGGVEIERTLTSAIDGTVKYLFRMEDGELIEGVFMRYKHGGTLCLSTQAGCRMGCTFCASTIGGCTRDLRHGEMLHMLILAEKANAKDTEGRAVTNIVLMGSGEPLDNFDEVTAFLLRAVNELHISARNISLSTCGLVPEMRRLAREAPHVTLAVSLHAHDDAARDALMPINKKYPIREVVAAAKEYAQETGRRVIFEYALINGVNTSDGDADALANLLGGMNCHVNLIPLNPVPERGFVGATREDTARFLARLEKRRISATVRRRMGADIEGACGQLRRRAMQEEGI